MAVRLQGRKLDCKATLKPHIRCLGSLPCA